MSQTVYENYPDQAREGFAVDVGLRDIITRIAEEDDMFVGKLAVASTGQSEDLIKLPTLAADITTVGLVSGVIFNDVSRETPDAAIAAQYDTDDAVPLVKTGRIWVLAEDEITDLDQLVYVRWQVPGGSPPDASLGSFAGAASANHAILANARWRSRTVGTFQLATLELNL